MNELERKLERAAKRKRKAWLAASNARAAFDQVVVEALDGGVNIARAAAIAKVGRHNIKEARDRAHRQPPVVTD